jgi:hypothetical protein
MHNSKLRRLVKKICDNKLLRAIKWLVVGTCKQVCVITLYSIICLARLLKWVSIFAIAVLLAVKLSDSPIPVIPGIPVPGRVVNSKQVHELIPHTRWSQLRPCGAYIEEKEEFEKAKQCVNGNVPLFKKKPIAKDALPPRCFIITTDSPNVLQGSDYNAIPVIDIFSGKMGGILGFYDEFSQTVYVVENVDASQVYRHELQHHFQHVIGQTVNHEGEVWNKCEPPRYSPSKKSIIVHRIIDGPEELE